MILLSLAMIMMNTQMTMSESSDQSFCKDYHPQKYIDLEQITGMWYVIEIIEHGPDTGFYRGDLFMFTCPTFHIARETNSNYRIVWSEPTEVNNYFLRLPSTKSPGFWLSSGPHHETVIGDPGNALDYSGTIQVMKAVDNHLVLTICSTRGKSPLFSVLLARQKYLHYREIKGVNDMLERRNLRPLFRKYTCSGASTITSFLFQNIIVVAIWRFIA